MAINFSGAEFEDNLVRLMKAYGVEDIAAYRDKCLAYAQTVGLSGLSDRLEAAKKTGRPAEDEIDSLTDLLNVSGGADHIESGPPFSGGAQITLLAKMKTLSWHSFSIFGDTEPDTTGIVTKENELEDEE